MTKTTKRAVVVLAVLLLAIAIFMLTRGSGDRTGSTRSSPSAASSGAAVGSSDTAATSDARAPVQPGYEHRVTMLAAIERARVARSQGAAPARPPVAPGGTTGTDTRGTTLDLVDRTGDTSDWQKRAHGTLNSLLGQCYDLGRAEDPNLDGTLTVRFTLVGEPEIGGLLERVEIVDGDTTITQPTLRECVTQQLYALELDPPPVGVSVEREISLKFP